MATPIELTWLPNLPGALKRSGESVLVMAFDEHTTKQYPNGRFMLASAKSGSVSWAKLEDVCLDPKYLRDSGDADAGLPTGPPCVMCGQPTPSVSGQDPD